MENLFETEYLTAKNNISDINQHIPVIFEYACRVKHITEMGVRTGVSTRAFLYAVQKCNSLLRSYDIVFNDKVNDLFVEAKKANLNANYMMGNTLKIEIEETDLLFIDTDHTYSQLSQELKLHGNKARKYIIFHDTTTFPELNKAIYEFLDNNNFWKICYVTANNNGLTILERQ